MVNPNADSVRSEIKRVGNPFKHNRIVRTEYYTTVLFVLDDDEIEIPMKVDTGSPYTIIGLRSKAMLQHRDKILSKVSDLEVYDASDSRLDIEQYNVTDFKLTDEITYDNVTICFSDKLGKKSVLGMDILSLYEFKHEFYGRSHASSIFYLINYRDTEMRIKEHLAKSETDVLYPLSVLPVQD